MVKNSLSLTFSMHISDLFECQTEPFKYNDIHVGDAGVSGLAVLVITLHQQVPTEVISQLCTTACSLDQEGRQVQLCHKKTGILYFITSTGNYCLYMTIIIM